MDNQYSQTAVNFEWHSLLRDILKNFWAIIMAGCIAGMGIYIGTHSVYLPQYTSSATLVVRSKNGTADVYSNLAVASDMAEIYTRIFVQPSLKQLAAENLGQNTFDGKISAHVMGTTNMMELSVSSDNPEKAFQLLKSVLEIYPNISEAVFTDAIIDILKMPEVPVGSSNSFSSTRSRQIILFAMLLEGAAIIALSLFRNTVKNERAFYQKIDSVLIGTISHEKSPLKWKERLKGKKQSILINDVNTGMRFCEDYYKLAAKFEYFQRKEHGKVFSVTSTAENEGKSTVCINTALALAECGYKVALLDLDIRKPAIYKMVNFFRPIKIDFPDVFSGKIPLDQMRLYQYRNTDLFIGLSNSPHSRTTQWISYEAARECIDKLKEDMDFIIIDTPPIMVSADAVMLAAFSDMVCLVVRTDRVAAQDVNDTILTLQNTSAQFAGCILNDLHKSFTLFGQMGETEEGYHGYYHGYHYYAQTHSYSKKPQDKKYNPNH